MDFQNINKFDGFAIAGTGLLIVFVALTMISVFIALLPKVLAILAVFLPPETEHQRFSSANNSTDDEEVAVAIAFALHQAELQKQ